VHRSTGELQLLGPPRAGATRALLAALGAPSQTALELRR
jgi:hypothetical protein